MRNSKGIASIDTPGSLALEIEQLIAGRKKWTTVPLRALRRQYSRRIQDCPPDFVLQLAKLLLQKPEFLYRFMAYELIAMHRMTMASMSAGQVTALGRGINSWESVDTFACLVAGPCWAAGNLQDDVILDWARSPNRWWRRASLVSTVPFSRQTDLTQDDVHRVLRICKLLVADSDDMVYKAMSWALRVLSVQARADVERFLVTNQSDLAARVIREVNNKIRTGLKNPKPTPRISGGPRSAAE